MHGRRLAIAAAVLAISAALALDYLPIYRTCFYGLATGVAYASPSPAQVTKRYAVDPVIAGPICRMTGYMGGSNPVPALGLLLTSAMFGLFVLSAIRFPAIVAGLGLAWIDAWGYLIYWLADIPSQWQHFQLVWGLGFQIPIGGEGYLVIMLPASLVALGGAGAALYGSPVLPNATPFPDIRATRASRRR